MEESEEMTMAASPMKPALFALQTEREAVVPNDRVAAYEETLSTELGVSLRDVHIASSGTTTSSGDSAED